MKKLLVIFIVFFGTMPLVNADQLSDANEWKCITTMKKQLDPDDYMSLDHFFCTNPQKNPTKIKWDCFKADSDACVKNTTICMLGTDIDLKTIQETTTEGVTFKPKQTQEGTYTYKDMLLGYKVCAISYEGKGSDNWYKHYNPKTNAIKDCPDKKWERTNNKTDEVMIIDGKAQIDDNGHPLSYWIKYYATPTFPNICVGYYCKNSNGKYQEPCADGTCSTNCLNHDNTDPENNNGNNGNNSNSGGGDDNGADNPSSADTPKLNPPHSAKPYMNKLKTKYKISAK